MYKPANHGKTWGKAEIAKLRSLARLDKPTTTIAKLMKRTVRAIESKAHDVHVSLRRPN